MFYVKLADQRDHSWSLRYPGEEFPFFIDLKEITVFAAHDTELGFILSRFSSVPYCNCSTTWYYPWAQFLFANLVQFGVIPVNPGQKGRGFYGFMNNPLSPFPVPIDG